MNYLHAWADADYVIEYMQSMNVRACKLYICRTSYRTVFHPHM
jgi:hypothetical protein